MERPLGWITVAAYTTHAERKGDVGVSATVVVQPNSIVGSAPHELLVLPSSFRSGAHAELGAMGSEHLSVEMQLGWVGVQQPPKTSAFRFSKYNLLRHRAREQQEGDGSSQARAALRILKRPQRRSE